MYLQRFNALEIFPTLRGDREDGTGSATGSDITIMLKQIQIHPEKTKFLLLQVLQDFPIQEHDREVLADNFSQLSLPELEKAILDLKKSITG